MVWESFFDAVIPDVLDFDTRSSTVSLRESSGSSPDAYAEEHFADRLAKIDEALSVCEGMLNAITRLEQEVRVLQNLSDGGTRPELDRLATDLSNLRKDIQATRNSLSFAHQLLSTAEGKTDAGIRTLLLDIQGTLDTAESSLQLADREYDRLQRTLQRIAGRGSREV